MTMRMLIDARHSEEIRVAVVKGNRIEEFDFESAEHKQLKGNIYLAKVTRVEPSLQAAFIDYGGNRHGFLAFSEIHPDYYQIPKADREALLREEAEHAAEEERLRAAGEDFDPIDDHHDDDGFDDRPDEPEADPESQTGEATGTGAATATEAGTGSNRSPVDESAADELRKRRQALRRRYKIQDVIQRRQVLLVQVVKEERGNKGAALTTYLSLAGRYCVLMPNTSHGGGISRKIPNGADRKRLKSIMSDLKLPTSMGLIVRTAGLSRTKTEIKRDFDYLARLWDEIRDRTLGSTAPMLIYRDSDLIKRAIRDLYHRDIDEVIIEGEDGYKAARGFMKLLMPSHVRRVQQFAESTPIFQRFGVEDQLSAMYQPVVQLKSGGYLVINPTEALVSIDINSGRSTREHNIEQTAYNTNIEAAQEIARQLRLRDMAGLVVIDFIDMEHGNHVRKVEKAMKEALKNDRARIQVGRISSFGLMEMSRQRLRTGVLEASTKPCAHCEGTGLMRTASSSGLSALRIIEDEAARGRGDRITLRAGREAAVFVLNRKRAELADIERRYGVTIEVIIDDVLEGARMAVESSGPRPVAVQAPPAVPIAANDHDDDDDDDDDVVVDDEGEDEDEDETDELEITLADEEEREESAERADDGDRPGRRRRRRRRGGRGRGRRDLEERGERADSDQEGAAEAPTEEAAEEAVPKRGRRRGGRKPRETGDLIEPGRSPMIERPIDEEPPIAETEAMPEEAPKPRRRRKAAEVETVETAEPAEPAKKGRAKATGRSKAEAPVEAAPELEPAKAEPAEDEQPAKKPRASRAKAAKPKAAADVAAQLASEPVDEDDGKPRSGWWQRTFG
ncbi:MAG: Rne/Rng family ribonuclease [Sphingomicrobium sp.]